MRISPDKGKLDADNGLVYDLNTATEGGGETSQASFAGGMYHRNCKPFKVLSLSDGGTPSTTRNKAFLESCDLYLPSTCYKKEDVMLYPNFESLPFRRGYGVIIDEADREEDIRGGDEGYDHPGQGEEDLL